jgi:GNAT superfamily N-acetyltransferase
LQAHKKTMMNVREAHKYDIPQLLNLIKELALYEKAPEQVINTTQKMLEDGFGKNKIYDAFVAELDGQIVGCAIVYYRYSTWKGRCLYLEDLIVSEAYRGQGAGKLLFERCIAFGKEKDCVLMNWQVLDWNTPAIEFYKKYNATLDGEWINGILTL